MHTSRPVRRAAAVGVAAVLSASCASGGGGSDATTSTDTSTSGAGATTTTTLPDAEPTGAVPEVRGPIEGGVHGEPATAMPVGLADEHGYVEEEFLLSGEAVAYEAVGALGEDGRWTVAETEAAPYTTRLLVRRPASPDDFDGTVVVEWLNVSSGQDNDVVFGHVHPELLDHGTAWVGVSAQAVGIEGGPAFEIPGVEPQPLLEADPERYAGLAHPGDDHAYDLFTQAGRAIRGEGDVHPLGPLEPDRLLAVGESQSAARLTTYVDAVQPIAGVFDGFLLHSRSSTGAALAAGAEMPARVLVREDLEVPVLQLVTETDVLGLPFLPARQADGELLRTWEVAGAAHLDRSLVAYRAAAARPWHPRPAGSIEDECGPVNDGPQSVVARAAVAGLRSWVSDGGPPSSAPRIEVADGVIVRDELGIAVGGVRTPAVEAPTVVLRGDAEPSTGYLCGLFGRTLPLPDGELERRYPDHDAYVAAVRASADASVATGHLLDADAEAIVAAAEASDVGG